MTGGLRKVILISFFIYFGPENAVPGGQDWPMRFGGFLVVSIFNIFMYKIYALNSLGE